MVRPAVFLLAPPDNGPTVERTLGARERWPNQPRPYGRVSVRAPVAQGIEHRPPEAGAQVRILPGALPKGAGQRWYDAQHSACSLAGEQEFTGALAGERNRELTSNEARIGTVLRLVERRRSR